MPRTHKDHGFYNGKSFKGTLIHYLREDTEYYFKANGSHVFITSPNRGFGLHGDEYEFVKKWLKTFDSKATSVNEWLKIVVSIGRAFEISQDIRSEAFSMYRSTIFHRIKVSLKAARKQLSECVKVAPLMGSAAGYLMTEEKQLVKIREELKSTKAGHTKLIYFLLRPLLTKLDIMGYSLSEQQQIVFELFKIGKFDNFDQKYLDKEGYFDEENATKYIGQLLRRTLEIQ